MSSVDVIIPVYKPDDKLKGLLDALRLQIKQPDNIILLWTIPDGVSENEIDTDLYVRKQEYDTNNIEIHFIEQKDFDHGGTRAYGASLSKADFIMFMTQDALPFDNRLTESLVNRFDDENVGAAYARQLPALNAKYLEAITREFNYPETERIQNSETLEQYGIKTYFCSDVCAMYRKSYYEQAGGFVKKTIFNEDMLMAAKLVELGYTIMYTPEAKVYHSHNYSYKEQFKRNFDLAVSQKEYADVFDSVPSESEGIKMVLSTTKKLLKSGRFYLIPDLFLQSAFKYLGYRKGKKFDTLSHDKIMKYTMNKSYWK